VVKKVYAKTWPGIGYSPYYRQPADAVLGIAIPRGDKGVLGSDDLEARFLEGFCRQLLCGKLHADHDLPGLRQKSFAASASGQDTN
jgi:hypothetical protein